MAYPKQRSRPAIPWWMIVAIGIVCGLGPAAQARACTVSSTVVTTLGSYSPAAVRASAVPALKSRAGMTCASSTLTLLSGNYLRGTFSSRNGLTLVQQGGAASIGYVASADPNGTYAFGQNTTIDYMQNNLLNLLGLLGGSSADLPFFVRPASGTLPPVGTYTDRITMTWSWYQCPGGVSTLGVCVGGADTGTGVPAVIDVTLIVTPQNAVLTMTSSVTWDPVNQTTNPKGVPGSRRRIAASLANTDIVPVDAGTLNVVLPTPVGTIVALDGDGGTAGTTITMTDGSPASGLTMRYGGPSDATDDVDFSSDGGRTWTYVPVAGDTTSEGAVTHVRIRPKGVMAKQSSVSVSVPYLLR